MISEDRMIDIKVIKNTQSEIIVEMIEQQPLPRIMHLIKCHYTAIA